jgi:hypothetical protein
MARESKAKRSTVLYSIIGSHPKLSVSMKQLLKNSVERSK